MATVTITIPDAELPRVVEALCVTRNVSPPTAANAKAALIGWVRETVITYEAAKTTRAAIAAVTPPGDPGVT